MVKQSDGRGRPVRPRPPATAVSQFALRLDNAQPARCYEPPFYAVTLLNKDEVIVHFYDYSYGGPVVAYEPVPDIAVDDEAAAADFQKQGERSR